MAAFKYLGLYAGCPDTVSLGQVSGDLGDPLVAVSQSGLARERIGRVDLDSRAHG
jgi:hypothetical protein